MVEYKPAFNCGMRIPLLFPEAFGMAANELAKCRRIISEEMLPVKFPEFKGVECVLSSLRCDRCWSGGERLDLFCLLLELM